MIMKKTLGLIALIAALSAPVYADNWKVDPVHTTVLFKVHHLGAGRFIGRFNDTSGTIKWDDADPTKSTIEITVKTESVDTANADRDKHLRSPDFFNAKQHPSITFKSTKVEKDGEKFKLTGDLTLHGETHAVTASFELTGKGKGMKGEERVGGEATFKIKRSEWGMKGFAEAIGDEVDLTVSIEAVKE